MNTASNIWKTIFISCLLFAGYVVYAVSAEVQTQVYENGTCGISFRYPEGWIIQVVPPEEFRDGRQLCALQMRPKDLARHLKEDDNVDLYTIQMVVSKRYLDEAATSAGFERRETKWVVLGEGESPAEEISSSRWIGLKGEVGGRCYHEEGGYAGQCETIRAVLNNRSNSSAVIYGATQSFDVFELLLKSLVFGEPLSGKKQGKK